MAIRNDLRGAQLVADLGACEKRNNNNRLALISVQS